jgi:hypothetical protein
MRLHLCLVLPMVIFPALLAYGDENRATNTAADKVMDIEDVKRQAVLGIDFISNEELKARIKRTRSSSCSTCERKPNITLDICAVPRGWSAALRSSCSRARYLTPMRRSLFIARLVIVLGWW